MLSSGWDGQYKTDYNIETETSNPFTAVFELAIIRMSRFYDVSQKAVLFLDRGMLTMDVFMTTGDTCEMELVSQIFDFAKSLAEMQLSEASPSAQGFLH